MKTKLTILRAVLFALTLIVAPAALAQSAQDAGTQTAPAAGASVRSVANGQKMKIKGVVVRRNGDNFVVRDANGVDTVVRLTDRTSVKERKSNPFRRAKNYAMTDILPGLNLEVEGRGDTTGQLVAEKVQFSDDELRVARALEARVTPVESRVSSTESRLSQVEQNAQRLSGQLEELAAISNAARGGAVAAQATADAAVAGVRATNERISALDDYVPQQVLTVNFRVGSAVLSPQAKAQLDQLAQQAQQAKGYMIEVTGFADATGSPEFNRRLSQRRADAVVRYLVEIHKIPLRRIITPYGFGESQPVADNMTREGRARNRRVEVRLLVSRGLTQPAPEMNVPPAPTTTTRMTGNNNPGL
jgi:outer membrane protein OmpA-like peptidoglycan-associated protein